MLIKTALFDYFFDLLYFLNKRNADDNCIIFDDLSFLLQEEILKQLKNTYELSDADCSFMRYDNFSFINAPETLEGQTMLKTNHKISLMLIGFRPKGYVMATKNTFLKNVEFWYLDETENQFYCKILQNINNKL